MHTRILSHSIATVYPNPKFARQAVIYRALNMHTDIQRARRRKQYGAQLYRQPIIALFFYCRFSDRIIWI